MTPADRNQGTPDTCDHEPTCSHPCVECMEDALDNANVAYGYAQASLAAVKLALEFRGMARPEEIQKVIARLVRDVPVDTRDTEPTRMLVEAIKIERRPGV